MKEYSKIKALEDLYLEDSYVLSIAEKNGYISFGMEFVLCETHSNYANPKEGEQYCYRRGKLEFKGCKEISWSEKAFTTFKDKDGNADFGNIDSFFRDGCINYLEGDWGRVSIVNDESDVLVSLQDFSS